MSAVDERGGPEDLLPFAAKADIIVMCCMLNEETVGVGWRNGWGRRWCNDDFWETGREEQ